MKRSFFVFTEEDEQYNQQINTLFRTVHIGTFNTSVQVCTAVALFHFLGPFSLMSRNAPNPEFGSSYKTGLFVVFI